MLHNGMKRSTHLALAGVFALAMAGSAAAAPLSSAGKTAVVDPTPVARPADIQPIVYHHHVRHHHHYYGDRVGAAVAGTALGLIGGAIAASNGYGYPYGYGYGPGYYGYGYGPGFGGGVW